MAADSIAKELILIAKDRKVSHSARIQAMNSILDRAGLNPRQLLEISGIDGAPIEIEIAARLAQGRERVAQEVLPEPANNQ